MASPLHEAQKQKVKGVQGPLGRIEPNVCEL